MSIVQTRPLSGGCINAACLASLSDGETCFVKLNDRGPADMFEREAEGLEALAQAGTIRVPRPLVLGTSPTGARFLALETVVEGRQDSGFQRRFGHELAELHRATRQTQFGFASDNYLGSTPQPNSWQENWCAFWRTARIGHQLELARRNGYATSELSQLGDRLLDRLDEWIAEPDEPACLLHGDLWSGNYLVDEQGAPTLIDPAAYYGRREAELAMTRLFGGFSSDFYESYHETWPLADGSDERIELYTLYHLLNHLNLFGSSYLGGCLSILRRYA